MNRLLTSTLYSSLLFCFTTEAKLLNFTKENVDDNYRFHYQWTDSHKKIDEITFTLPKKALFDRHRNFKAYKPEIANKFIQSKLKKHLIQNPLSDVTINYVQNSDDIIITGQSDAAVKSAQQELALLQQKYFQVYLKNHYYQSFTTHDNITGIKPDHVKFASEAVADFKELKSIILDKVSIQNIRLVTNFTLSWLQNIPYSPLESRMSSSGMGFNPPLSVLWENQGDCDSKVTLMASLLRSLMPRIKIALVFIDNHALIAIQIPPVNDDLSIIINQETYVLGDPTGPKLLELGKVSENVKNAILQGHYSTEMME